MTIVQSDDVNEVVYRRVVETVMLLDGTIIPSYTLDGRGGSKKAKQGAHRMIRVTFNRHSDRTEMYCHLETRKLVWTGPGKPGKPNKKGPTGKYKVSEWKRLKNKGGELVDSIRKGKISIANVDLGVATLALQMSRRDAFEKLVTDYHDAENENGPDEWGPLVLEHLGLKKTDVQGASINHPSKCWISDNFGNLIVECPFLTSAEKRGISASNYYETLTE